MAEGRAQEVSREARKEELLRKRSSGFKLNAEEMESFRLAAEEAKSHAPPRSPTRQADSVDYGREAVMQAFHENRATGLKRSNTTSSLPRLEKSAILDSAGEEGTTKTQNDSDNKYGGDSSLYEPFSQLHLSNRVLPHSFLKRTFDSAEPVRIPWVLRNIISPDYELPSSITSDFVLFGIVASKSDTRDHQTKGAESSIRGSNEWEKKWDDGSQNEKKYMVMKLTDLVWTIDLYLFGTALPRYHRISPGTVVAILNPGIMPPKPGKKDTGQFSLTINSGGDTILEVGTARDLGFCKAIRKDGRQCEEWLDRRKSDFCDWHVDAQVRKTQAGRMGLNSSASSILSSNRLAPRGGRLGQTGGSRSQRGGREEQDTLTRGGARYDRYTQSTYYMVPSAAPGLNRNANGRPQSSLSDDPFLAAGTPSRELISKSERLRKRIAHEAKEREIARKLGEGDIGRSKSAAGGEYLRKRSVANTTGNSSVSSTPSSKSDDLTSSNTSKPSAGSQMLSHILSRSSSIDAPSLVNSNGKRSADDVHLSPIKKKAALVTGSIDGTKSNKGKKVTRFITEKGIREAGRESLPGPGAINDGNDDDDDLDIV